MHKGELVLLHLYDVGGEVRLSEAARLAAAFTPDADAAPIKTAPQYIEFGRPLSFRLGERVLVTDRGAIPVLITARLYAIGAVSVTLRIPFELDTLDDVIRFSHLRLQGGAPLKTIPHEIADVFRNTIEPSIIETYPVTIEPEGHLVVVLTETDESAGRLLETERSTLAGILAGETNSARLSREEVEDNLAYFYRYFDDDLVVVDWDRSLIIEPTGKYEDVLSVIELANLELLELRAYDRYLDGVLERAYGDLTRFYGRGGLFRSAREVQKDLSDVRIDLVRVTDAINNIGKIFGDYYLAKLHLGLNERYHLAEWESIVREKMATLNELYTLASHEVEHRRGILLEGMIVLLFVVDLVLLVLVSK